MSVADLQTSELAAVHDVELDAPEGGPEQPDGDAEAVATDNASEAGDLATDAASVDGKSTVTDSPITTSTQADDDAAPVAKPTSKPSLTGRKSMASSASKPNGTSASVKKVCNAVLISGSLACIDI
jgi:hypothetical protein